MDNINLKLLVISNRDEFRAHAESVVCVRDLATAYKLVVSNSLQKALDIAVFAVLSWKPEIGGFRMFNEENLLMEITCGR